MARPARAIGNHPRTATPRTLDVGADCDLRWRAGIAAMAGGARLSISYQDGAATHCGIANAGIRSGCSAVEYLLTGTRWRSPISQNT